MSIPPMPQQPSDASVPALAQATAIAPPSGAVTVTPFAVPHTVGELRALRERREELSNQLVSATSRRNELVERLKETPVAAQDGLVERIQLLDRRILKLETDIAESGRAVASAPSTLLAGSELPALPPLPGTSGGPQQFAMFALLIMITLVVLTAVRNFWRRGGRPVPSAESRESAARLVRLEQAVDAIAIEMERVSESQRFLTRVLAESPPERVTVAQDAVRRS